ncbi:hypothetical protein MMC28_007057 [Mycoblastus sanguinarius]|nr:hypothetical protein [Mycoblastus sanguinarius]
MAILSHFNGIDSHTAMPSQHGEQRVAAAFDMKTTQENNRVRAFADARDYLGRTALLSTAASGCEKCCYVLLQANANPNSRDSNGHTVLEMASIGGHLQVVGQLLAVECDVNPPIIGCESSPLQAAIESDKFDLGLVNELLDRGASVDDERCDGKTAIDLADDKKWSISPRTCGSGLPPLSYEL